MADASPSGSVVYRAEGVKRQFGGVAALSGVDFVLRPGEIHALLGANGAGKSTLVKILAGADRPTAGSVALHGKQVDFGSTQQAAEAGIALVSQELNLFPDLSALHNLFLTREPRRWHVAVLKSAMRERARKVVQDVGITFDLDRQVSTLDLADRQLLEIARALVEEPSILILDEPTSALQAAETERLLGVLERLRDRGVAIVFVSHFLEDTFRIADRVTILRGGRAVVSDRPAASLSVSDAITEMLGEAPPDPSSRAREQQEPRASGGSTDRTADLRLEDVSIGTQVQQVTFDAPRGVVTGLAGLEGSGARSVMRAIFGDLKASHGRVTLPGDRPVPRSIPRAVKAGVAFVPVDRKKTGLMLEKSIAENIALVAGGPLKRMGVTLGRRKLNDKAEYWRQRLGIEMGRPSDPVNWLSGGNQQKVVFAKWLEAAPEVLLLDDPSRGVDVGAKRSMHRLIREAAQERVVLYTSSDFEEMAEICDRIFVFFNGRLAGEMTTGFSEHRVLEAVNTGRLGEEDPGPEPAATPGQR